MSWHINEKGKSVIKEVIDKFSGDKNSYIQIFTVDDDFYIFDDDNCIVAKDFIYIQSNNNHETSISIINSNMIESIYVKSVDENASDSE